jgi:hypothetical protein
MSKGWFTIDRKQFAYLELPRHIAWCENEAKFYQIELSQCRTKVKIVFETYPIKDNLVRSNIV